MRHGLERGHARRRTDGLGPRPVAGWGTVARLEPVGRSRRQHHGIHGRALYPASAGSFEGGSNANRVHQPAGAPSSSLSLGSFPIDRKGVTAYRVFSNANCIFCAPAIPFVVETRPSPNNWI